MPPASDFRRRRFIYASPPPPAASIIDAIAFDYAFDADFILIFS